MNINFEDDLPQSRRFWVAITVAMILVVLTVAALYTLHKIDRSQTQDNKPVAVSTILPTAEPGSKVRVGYPPEYAPPSRVILVTPACK